MTSGRACTIVAYANSGFGYPAKERLPVVPMPDPRLTLPDRLIRCVPLAALRVLTPRPFVSLVYHLVSEQTPPHVRHLYPCKTPEAFERDLSYLKKHCHLVGHEDIAAHRKLGRDLPKNAVTLTFDDGFAECFSVARPLLQKYSIPATFFVIANCIDNRAMMFRSKISLCFGRLADLPLGAAEDLLARFRSRFERPFENLGAVRSWLDGLEFEDTAHVDAACDMLGVDVARILREEKPYLTCSEILQLRSEGFTIGAHTCNHPRLHRMKWEDARREIVDSCRAVQDLTGQDDVPFAIPFEGLSLRRDRLAELRRTHPVLSLVYDSHNLMKDRDFMVNRIWCDPPRGDAPGRSNLPLLLKRAYAFEPLRVLKRSVASR